MNQSTVYAIAKSLESLVEPVDQLKEFPGNPRRGNVEAISSSLAEFGQQAPIVVQASTGYVIAGNHMLRAARDLGWTHIAVARLDVDDETARAYLLADNRLSDLAVYDSAALVKLLSGLAAQDALTGTGFTRDELDALILALPEPREEGTSTASALPLALHTVTLLLPPDEATTFLRWCATLRKRTGAASTAAAILGAVERQAAQ